MAVLPDNIWERHTNKWSGWTRVLVIPLLFVALWHHSGVAVFFIILWIIVNPMAFPPPKSTDNWMSKGVMGEKIYTQNGVFHWDFPTFLNIINGLTFFPSLYFMYMQNFWPALYLATFSIVVKFWYLDRMVFLYEAKNRGKSI